MEPEEMVHRTGLYSVSPGHQFRIAGRGSVKDQNRRDPGQKSRFASGRQDRETPDDPPRQHLRRAERLHRHVKRHRMAVSEPEGAKPDYQGPSVPSAQQGRPDGRYAGRHRHAHPSENVRLLALQAVPGHCRAAEYPQPCASADYTALHRHHGRADRKQFEIISPVKRLDSFCGVLISPKTAFKGGKSVFVGICLVKHAFFFSNVQRAFLGD